jgi:hypothetical protein
MISLSKIPFVLIVSIAIVQGIVLLVRGNVRGRFASGYDMLYKGKWVRFLGLISILLGVVFALTVLELISGILTIVLFLLIGLPGGIAGIIVQQNGILIKK